MANFGQLDSSIQRLGSSSYNNGRSRGEDYRASGLQRNIRQANSNHEGRATSLSNLQIVNEQMTGEN